MFFIYKTTFVEYNVWLMKKILWMMFLIGVLLGCSGSKQGNSEKAIVNSQEQVIDNHNARNSLDYQGTYTGIIPGYDSKAVSISIVLTEREYVLRSTPLKENAETIIQKGEYVWNKNGSVITLIGVKGISSKYFVAENQLRQLDKDGKQHVGENAANYILRKHWDS